MICFAWSKRLQMNYPWICLRFPSLARNEATMWWFPLCQWNKSEWYGYKERFYPTGKQTNEQQRQQQQQQQQQQIKTHKKQTNTNSNHRQKTTLHSIIAKVVGISKFWYRKPWPQHIMRMERCCPLFMEVTYSSSFFGYRIRLDISLSADF